MWHWERNAGVTFRSLSNAPTYTWDSSDSVASGRRHLEMFIYYTDWHTVDEDMVTASLQGGSCANGGTVGITCLQIMNPLTDAYDGVASSNMKN